MCSFAACLCPCQCVFCKCAHFLCGSRMRLKNVLNYSHTKRKINGAWLRFALRRLFSHYNTICFIFFLLLLCFLFVALSLLLIFICALAFIEFLFRVFLHEYLAFLVFHVENKKKEHRHTHTKQCSFIRIISDGRPNAKRKQCNRTEKKKHAKRTAIRCEDQSKMVQR